MSDSNTPLRSSKVKNKIYLADKKTLNKVANDVEQIKENINTGGDGTGVNLPGVVRHIQSGLGEIPIQHFGETVLTGGLYRSTFSILLTGFTNKEKIVIVSYPFVVARISGNVDWSIIPCRYELYNTNELRALYYWEPGIEYKYMKVIGEYQVVEYY